MEGVATKESIDSIMKLGMAHPMGPLTLADLIGLDVCLSEHWRFVLPRFHLRAATKNFSVISMASIPGRQ